MTDITEKVARAIEKVLYEDAPAKLEPGSTPYLLADAALSASGYREREALEKADEFIKEHFVSTGYGAKPVFTDGWAQGVCIKIEAALSPKEGA